jgi:putative methylase
VDAASIGLAQRAAADLRVQERTWFVAADLATWHPEPGAFDTVVMNPPFGAQKNNKHADRLFVERAAEAGRPAGTVWFLAQTRTEGFLAQQAKALGASIDRVATWPYPLEATMAHHREAARTVEVGAYRLSWSSAP